MALLQTRLGSTTRLSLKGLLVSKVSTSNMIHLIPDSDITICHIWTRPHRREGEESLRLSGELSWGWRGHQKWSLDESWRQCLAPELWTEGFSQSSDPWWLANFEACWYWNYNLLANFPIVGRGDETSFFVCLFFFFSTSVATKESGSAVYLFSESSLCCTKELQECLCSTLLPSIVNCPSFHKDIHSGRGLSQRGRQASTPNHEENNGWYNSWASN